MKIILFLYAILLLFSCNNRKDKATLLRVTNNAKTDSSGKLLNLLQKNSSEFPQQGDYDAKILTIDGVYHSDEVDPKWAKFNWQGIFKKDDSYYAAKTDVIIRHAYDAIADDKTGWEIKTSIKDSAILLVSNIDNLTDQKIKRINLSKSQLLPGESEDFICNGKTCTLYALGSKRSESPGSDIYSVKDYKLFLKVKKDGVEYNQLMVATNDETDTFANILFVGDIDGDGMPDFIVDTTKHENSEVQTLYLSKPSGKKSLLKVIGMHAVVGC
jgi:hypothetical protein